MKVLILLSMLTFVLQSQAGVKEELQQFHLNPKGYYNQLPRKVFNTNLLKKTTVAEKIKWRKDYFPQIASSLNGDKAEIRPNDSVSQLVSLPSLFDKISDMEDQKLQQGRVRVQPWSDDYWPIYKGILGARYADDVFGMLSKWDEANNYIEKAPAIEIFESKNELDKLSPSEKYDLLLGVENTILSKRMWMEGKYYYDEHGEVEKWMGICHGWAPASYMLERPTSKVQVMAADGETKITFYPSDIKALASLLWANVRTPSLFIGGRCNKKNPESDENGRVKDDICFDNNPGAWHMAIVNQVGIKKQSFVMDATFDYEVWNQPVISYQYAYFNTESLMESNTYKDVLIKVEDYKKDKFKQYRSPKAKFILGVAMDVEYGVEKNPVQRDEDSELYDGTVSVRYFYDLELDEDYKIIGGEWYSRAHPDFLWTPPDGTRAMSIGDYGLLGKALWNGKESLPDDWKQYGQRAAGRGQPLAKIVDSLLKLSNATKIENNEESK